MNRLANQFLKELQDASSHEVKVNTTLEGDALKIVRRYQGNKRIKEVVSALLEVANEYLTEVSKKEQNKTE